MSNLGGLLKRWKIIVRLDSKSGLTVYINELKRFTFSEACTLTFTFCCRVSVCLNLTSSAEISGRRSARFLATAGVD